jgi:hypothetical protein
MSGLSPQVSVLLTGLSDFWQRFFADKDQLETLYAATEEQLGQAYLDLLSNVLNSNVYHTPVFRKEYWHLYTTHYADMRYVAGDTYPYRCPATPGMKAAKYLWNRVYAPTISLETPQDFVLEDGEFRFSTDPFSTPGALTREVSIAPVPYLTARGASISGTTLTWTGETVRGRQGIAKQGYIFETSTDAFTQDDVGRQLVHTDPLDPALTVARVITTVVSPRLVGTDTLSPDATALSWRVIADGHFNVLSPGTSVILSAQGAQYTASIVSVTSPTEVEIDTQIADLQGAIDLEWQHVSGTRVKLMSWWIPDAMFDAEDLFLSFGYLVQRFEPSSEAYRALIIGLMRFYSMGPTPGRVESALNVMVGIPVIRSDGEILLSVEQKTDLLDVVTTSTESYTIPHGSVRTDIEVGYVFEAFESLTTVFKVQDHVTDPTWYHGETLPLEILPGQSSSRRSVDPQLYSALVGAKNWAVGDPNLAVGGDVTQGAVPEYRGKDMFVRAGDPTRLDVFQEYIDPSLIGSAIWIDNVKYVLEVIAAAPDLYIRVSNTVSPLVNHTQYTTPASTVVAGNDLMVLHGYSLAPEHIGRKIKVLTSVFVPQEVYEIYDIVSPDTVRVKNQAGATAQLPAEANYTVDIAREWRVQTRPPLQATIGYVLMHAILKHHVFSVEYRLADFPAVPYPRLTEDLRTALFEGRPAYTYLLIRAINAIRDLVLVSDSLHVIGVLTQSDTMTASGSPVKVGDAMLVGEYYTYADIDTAWVGTIRVAELGSPHELEVAQAQDVVFRLTVHNPDIAFEIDCQVETWDGTTWGAVGAPFTLSDAAPGPVTVGVSGDPVRLVSTVTNTADTYGIEYGFEFDTPTLLRAMPDGAYSTAGSLLIDTLSDLTVHFTARDVHREMYVEVESVYRRMSIASVLDAHTVHLISPETGLAPDFPALSSVAWYFGAQRRYATPVVVAGESPVVPRGTGGVIMGWPLQVRVEPATEPTLP